jgi:hypothetical protein
VTLKAAQRQISLDAIEFRQQVAEDLLVGLPSPESLVPQVRDKQSPESQITQTNIFSGTDARQIEKIR